MMALQDSPSARDHAARARRAPAPSRRRRGFSLIEALTALSVLAMAGAVVLLAVDVSLVSTDDVVQQTLADGLARQLVDAALAKRYAAVGASPYQTPLCPNSWEKSGPGWSRYDDADDFHGYARTQAEDEWGLPLGTGNDAGGQRPTAFRADSGWFRNWRQRCEVYYVDPADFSRRLRGSQTSDYRAIEAIIERVEADGAVVELARVRRVHAYVPPAD